VSPSRRLVRGLFLSLAALVLNIAIDVSAADPSLEVRLDPRVFGVEDAARLVVRILEPTGTPVVNLGDLDNLEVVSGPSTSSEFSWVNGAATRAVSYTYMLQGVEVGAASVGPVRVKIGDTELLAEAMSAEVVPGSVVPKRPGRRRSVFSLDPFEDIIGRRQPARSARVGLRQQVSARHHRARHHRERRRWFRVGDRAVLSGVVGATGRAAGADSGRGR